MALAHDLTTTNADTAGRSSASFSHTCTGSDLVLFVFILALNTAEEPTVSAITYAGNAMTLVAAQTNNFTGTRHIKAFCYQLADPPTGANTVSVTYGQTQAADVIVAGSYTGAEEAGASNTATGQTNTPTASLTTTVADSFVAGAFATLGADTVPFTPGSGVNERADLESGGGSTTSDAGVFVGDKVATATGAYTVDCTAAVSDHWAGVIVELKPATAGGTTYNQSAAGALTTAGTVVVQAGKSLASALASAGTVAKQTAKTFAGTLTTAGAIEAVKTVLLSLAGTLTTAGALTGRANKALAGALASSGVVSRLTSVSAAGALTTAGSVVRQAGKPLAGTLSTAGTLSRSAVKGLAGTLTSLGALPRVTSKAIAGTLASTGTLSQLTSKALAGVLSAAGTLAAVKSAVATAIVNLTLQARGFALTLPERAFNLSVRARSFALTLRERD